MNNFHFSDFKEKDFDISALVCAWHCPMIQRRSRLVSHIGNTVPTITNTYVTDLIQEVNLSDVLHKGFQPSQNSYLLKKTKKKTIRSIFCEYLR